MNPVIKGTEPVQCIIDRNVRSIDEDETFRKDWSDDEERRAKRKSVRAFWIHRTLDEYYATVTSECLALSSMILTPWPDQIGPDPHATSRARLLLLA